MHEHKTQHCDHDLKLCVDCDVVYCHKCAREWAKEKIVYRDRIIEYPRRSNPPPWKYVPSWPWTPKPSYPYPWTTTGGKNTLRLETTTAGKHNHNAL